METSYEKKISLRIRMIMTHKEFRLRAIKKVICHAWVFRYLVMDNKMNECLLYLVLLKYGLK